MLKSTGYIDGYELGKSHESILFAGDNVRSPIRLVSVQAIQQRDKEHTLRSRRRPRVENPEALWFNA